MSLMEIKQLSQDVYLFSDKKLGHYNNSTVIMTKEGPIIIDVFRDKDQFKQIKDFINHNGFEKPAAIIYTHWHTDHTCGNRVFNKTRVVSHQSTYSHLESFIKNDIERLKQKGILETDVEIVMPTETFLNDISINIGEKTLKLIHCPGHTYDSILVYDVKDKILIAGDNLISEETAFFIPPVIPPDEIDITHTEIENAYKIIERIEANIIIPGHGKILEPNKLIELNKKRYFRCLEENLKYIE